MHRITFITGGARSGKSTFAEKLALERSSSPLYIATARRWDADFEKRIARHQAIRAGKGWTTVEEEKNLSGLDLDGHTALIDCVTLWLTNIFTDNSFDLDRSLKEATDEWDRLIRKDCDLIVVSNEIGMGVHAIDEATRHFTDLQGFVNQHIARTADEVFLCVSGIPVPIKTQDHT